MLILLWLHSKLPNYRDVVLWCCGVFLILRCGDNCTDLQYFRPT